MRVRGRKREKRENQILQFSLGRFALSPHNCSDTLSNDPVFLGRYPLLYFFTHLVWGIFIRPGRECGWFNTEKRQNIFEKDQNKLWKPGPLWWRVSSTTSSMFSAWRLVTTSDRLKYLWCWPQNMIMLIIMIIAIIISRSWSFTGTWHRSAGNERAHARKANCGKHRNFIHHLFSSQTFHMSISIFQIKGSASLYYVVKVGWTQLLKSDWKWFNCLKSIWIRFYTSQSQWNQFVTFCEDCKRTVLEFAEIF